MDTNFAVGDTVQLKTGGALMCLRNFRDDEGRFVDCVWHDGRKPYERIYPLAILVKIADTPT